MSPLRVGLVLPLSGSDPAAVLSFADRAEELGFDGLFAFDHLFAPGGPPDRPSLEAFAALAAVAAITSRTTVGTLVVRAGLRSAGMVAKQAAALDDISGGRFILGIGTGDRLGRGEHEAFGLEYLKPAARRDHLVETARAVRALFRAEPWPGGEHVPAMPGPLLPPPRTAGGPPLWVGGVSEGAVAVAAAEADGWNGWGMDVEVFAARAALLRSRAGDRDVEATWGGAVVVGRDRSDAGERAEARRRRGISGDAFVGDPASAAVWLGRLADAGAAWAILLAAGGRDRVELIAERVLPHVAVGA